MTTTLPNDRTTPGDMQPPADDARDLFASLVSLYRDVGLSFHNATRAANADYDCAFEAAPERRP